VQIALVGIGEIARRQHIPIIGKSDEFELAAAVTRGETSGQLPAYRGVAEMKVAHPKVTALSICTPPIGRLGTVREALECDLDVMVEKPPAATVGEALAYVDLARAAGKTLYVTWHSRQAAGVGPARDWLAGRTIERVRVDWKEDVRVWHPGQEWIWRAGIGVFDPGINAMSVLTEILPRPLRVQAAELRFPENKDGPIAADLDMVSGCGAPVHVEFDFDHGGPPRWDIVVETAQGRMVLNDGGAKMSIDGVARDLRGAPGDSRLDSEYARLYGRFANLIANGQSETDLSPLRLVADAFLIGRRTTVGPFEEC
jgi:D-galactose 1-dehydrogenase